MMQSIASDTAIATNIQNDAMTSHDIEYAAEAIQCDISGNLLPSTDEPNTMIVKCCMIVPLVILTFPIAFCDIYFALHDHTCLDQSIDKTTITMKTFLLVSGIYTYTLVGVLCLVISTVNLTTSNDYTCILVLLGRLNQMFITLWTIVGAVLFWSQMNAATCSSQVYIYLFTTLVIKIVGIVFQMRTEDWPMHHE